MNGGLFLLLSFLGILFGIQASALRDLQKKWPNGKVPVRFHSSLSSSEKNTIKEAMQELHQKTCVRFESAIEDDKDFVLIVKPANDVACSSFLGRQGGHQTLNLGQFCFSREIILHELMHALGFVDEHERADRDEYITINYETIKEGRESAFKKRDQADLTLMNTGYAYDSILQHRHNILSKDGTPTMVAKNGTKLGGVQKLSSIDVERIKEYYGCDTNGQSNEM